MGILLEERPLLISTFPPDPRQERLAVVFVVLMSLVFIGSLPLRNLQLSRLDLFVPILDTILFIIDLITAALLYAHVSVLGSRSLLALASGYLFTALVIVVHALTFPGAFSPTGLLGAGIQTSNYLQIFWRAGLPCAAVAYALLKEGEPRSHLAGNSTGILILASVAIVFVAVCGLTLLVTVGGALLPDIMVNGERRIWAVDAPFIIPLEIAAIVLVWRRRRSVLDLWLLVVLSAWLIASLLVSTTAYRFSLVWYESRFYGLLASSFVLLGLLTQTTTLYARLAISTIMQRSERESRLMQVDATLAVVSHEVNQPLTAITLNGTAGLHELAKENPDNSTLEVILKDVVRDGHRASEIINGIRAMFRRDDSEAEELDVVVLIENALTLVSGDVHEHGVVIETELGSKLSSIKGNRIQLQQVIVNLVMNAVEAMDAITTRQRLLSVRANGDSDRIVMEIEDSGPGIDPEMNDTIFDPFVTSKSKGTGLGLSICRTIVESHGGRISAVNNSRGGAKMVVSIPAYRPQDQ
ncbi:ATP-binding protein [Mesorhizobium sp. B2-1-3A]|uniref:ATP-binding protein n=1 Tax=Mesorhizobium sp. B2-1-3A TaxID=2589971 RepID=UPI00112647F4|nr:ATP-binding protein [Mesorhizobium sp. B2-1-3A]TPM94839.1 GHKL domain-containing protein [Mesorhizobium sp. B2-1-3A]